MKNWKRFINIHTLLLVVVLVTIAFVIWRFKTWGVKVDLDEIARQDSGEYADTQDYMCPVTDENGHIVEDTDGVTTILFLGNSPFADDRDSEDGLVNMIAADSGATVYNASIRESYLSSSGDEFIADAVPMDAYALYWITSYLCMDSFEGYFAAAEAELGDECPQDAIEAYRTLQSVDMSTVDVIAIMYDAADYLKPRPVGDQDSENVMTYVGGLNASCSLLRQTYPNIRIIVMGVPYAYAVDSNGDYVSSSIYVYMEDTVLPDFSYGTNAVCVNQGITFVDNMFGTITEDNADQYLVDNVHINVEGRRLLADRFLAALTYYDD